MHFCFPKFTSNFSYVIFSPQSAAVAAQWIFRLNLSVSYDVAYKQPAGAGRSCPAWTPEGFSEGGTAFKPHRETLCEEWSAWCISDSSQLQSSACSLKRLVWVCGGLCAKGFIISFEVRAWRWAQLTLSIFTSWRVFFFFITFFNLTMDCCSPVELTFRVFHPFLRNVFKRSALHR